MEFKVDFRKSFKLVDNDDLTQNLHSLLFQNEHLIGEIDVGNIENILIQKKQLESNWKELKNKLVDLFNRSQDVCYLNVLQKMQELEGKDEN